MPCFSIHPLQEISSYLWINVTLTFESTLIKKYLNMIKIVHLPKLRTFWKKLKSVIVSQNNYLNKIFDVHKVKKNQKDFIKVIQVVQCCSTAVLLCCSEHSFIYIYIRKKLPNYDLKKTIGEILSRFIKFWNAAVKIHLKCIFKEETTWQLFKKIEWFDQDSSIPAVLQYCSENLF